MIFYQLFCGQVSPSYVGLRNKLTTCECSTLGTDITSLSVFTNKLKLEADECIAKLRRDEEAKWAQRAKVKHIQEGGNNTHYFHLIANGKHRKKQFSSLSKTKVQLSEKQILRLL